MKLTPREREVRLLVEQGLSNAEIGRRIGITRNTVSSHVRKILKHLGVNSKVEVLTLGQRLLQGALASRFSGLKCPACRGGLDVADVVDTVAICSYCDATIEIVLRVTSAQEILENEKKFQKLQNRVQRIRNLNLK